MIACQEAMFIKRYSNLTDEESIVPLLGCDDVLLVGAHCWPVVEFFIVIHPYIILISYFSFL